ncbi:MAG TPA: hypothetical protein VIY29_27710 [Ktedonobacteraceae bacterium]
MRKSVGVSSIERMDVAEEGDADLIIPRMRWGSHMCDGRNVRREVEQGEQDEGDPRVPTPRPHRPRPYEFGGWTT